MNDALMATYARIDLTFERGEGAYLYTADDRRYLDFAAGIGVNSVGHSHPHLIEALTAQAGRLWHCSNLYKIPEGSRLADRLAAHSFADRVFFSNSGAEAVEGALKLARKYHHHGGQPERMRVITLEGAFHGRTLTTLSAAANPKYLEGFGPASEGFDQVAFGNLNELRAALRPETGAILMEPVQGEGGVRPATLDYLRALREVCDEFGLLLVLDEVQCGLGRSGKLFAHEWAEITPDVVAVAKGLGGGFPVGAILATEKAASGMTAGSHGSTFGGNPLAMAVGNAVLDVILADGFLNEVDRISRLFWGELAALTDRHPKVFEEVRGAGLMLGVKCRIPNTELLGKLRDGGLLAATAADNVLRLLPPLTIGEAEVAEAVRIMEAAASDIAKAA